MKRANQFERTDRDITSAVLALMDRKPFEKITVQDILDEALVNRSTFYQHFTDKYAVLERLQEKFIAGMTGRMDTILAAGELDLEKINRVLYEYISSHREQMGKLLSVRSEGLDLQGQMKGLFAGYLERSKAPLNALERDMLSGMTVEFFVRFLKEEFGEIELPTVMLNTWLNMSVYFFRVEHVPDAAQRLLELVGEMHREK